MKYAVVPPVSANVMADPQWMVAYARHAESLGFESIVAVEHAVIISDRRSAYPYSRSGRFPLDDSCVVPDPIELLTFLAASTTTIGLATGVLILPEHHPVVLAKRLATLDRLSGGRLRLCVGLGWMREELEACGVEFSTRGRRMDESIEVLRTLWSPEPAEGLAHHGTFFSFTGARSNPKPVRGTIPIHIGGHSRAAAERAGRHGDGFQPLGLRGTELSDTLATVRQAAEGAGRNPEELELSLGGPMASTGPHDIEAARKLGAVRYVMTTSTNAEVSVACQELSDFAMRVGLSASA